VVADGIVVGRIVKAVAAPEGSPWLWTPSAGKPLANTVSECEANNQSDCTVSNAGRG
jgi:hypothetical protein